MKVHRIKEEIEKGTDITVDEIYIEYFKNNLYLNQKDYCNIEIPIGEYISTVMITKKQALELINVLNEFVSQTDYVISQSLN